MNNDQLFLKRLHLINGRKEYTQETDLNFVEDKQDLIRKKSSINPKSERIYFFITGWHETEWPSQLLKKRLTANGDSYISYTFAPFRLSSRYKEVQKNMLFIKKTVLEDIKKYKNKRIILICTSLGVIEGIMISSASKEVKKIVLLMPSDSLVDFIWEGIRTPYIKESLEAQRITRTQLKKIWHSQEPKNNIDGLKGKEIIICASKQDLIVPYARSLALIKEMEKRGMHPEVIINNNLGHHLTAAKFYNSKKTLEIIK